MKGTLYLKNVILRLKLGAQAPEKLAARDVPVTLTWKGEVKGGASIDYSDICHVLAGFNEREYDYIEDLALDILELLHSKYPAGCWNVTVTKPFPPVSLKLESASFTVEGGGGSV